MIVTINFKDKTTIRYTDVHYIGANKNNPDVLFVILRRPLKVKATQEYEQDKEILIPFSKIESYNVLNDRIPTDVNEESMKLEKKARPKNEIKNHFT